MVVPVFSVLRWVIGAGDGVAGGSFFGVADVGWGWRIGSRLDWRFVGGN